jgi:membrane protein DedA with SNARE-associated domain
MANRLPSAPATVGLITFAGALGGDITATANTLTEGHHAWAIWIVGTLATVAIVIAIGKWRKLWWTRQR